MCGGRRGPREQAKFFAPLPKDCKFYPRTGILNTSTGYKPGEQSEGVVRLKKAKWVRLLPVFALLAALLCLPVQAAGAPRAVLNAKDEVVRIFGEVDGGLVSGSGF